MAPVARRLAARCRVIEPFQRPSGPDHQTVALHVADMAELLETLGWDRTHLVGSSWGAMLALAFAAEVPARVESLVLVGCGTFDPVARARFRELRHARTTPPLQRRLDRANGLGDPAERLAAQARVMHLVYSHDADDDQTEPGRVDPRANRETWDDMLRLQAEGVYPAAFQRIRAPVLMLHGSEDPHPGRMIFDSLRPYVADLTYHEWVECGHYPWLERAASEDFYDRLGRWIQDTGDRRDRPETAKPGRRTGRGG
jgi:pimeloyl-ACP methyl ester carboxylesterase